MLVSCWANRLDVMMKGAQRSLFLFGEHTMSEVIKIKPSHPSQGDYVLIDAANFDESKHERLDAPKRTRASKQVEPVVEVKEAE